MTRWRRGVAQFGSARGLGPWGRRFESCRPDHLSIGRRPLKASVSAFAFFTLYEKVTKLQNKLKKKY